MAVDKSLKLSAVRLYPTEIVSRLAKTRGPWHQRANSPVTYEPGPFYFDARFLIFDKRLPVTLPGEHQVLRIPSASD